jgi:hypothetical protein
MMGAERNSHNEQPDARSQHNRTEFA